MSDKETMRVLIVDDDTLLRGLCALALRPAGYELQEAESGEDALKCFATARVDLVILDVQMAGIDGYETCRRIRQLPGGDLVPIVMLTGLDDVDSVERAYEAGATDFIAKPFQWPVLAQRVRYALRAARTAQIRQQRNSTSSADSGEVETDLRRALADGDEMLMYLQPKVDIRTGMVCGAEALIRWQHPVHGLLLPAEFIPVAEKNGLIGQITEWMLEQACRQLAAWRGAGLDAVPISVNIAASWLTHRSLLDHLDSLLQRYQLSPGMLVFEVGGAPQACDVDSCVERVLELRQRGIAISMDNFGMGYSSLACLKDLALDEIKLDRAFVTDVAVSERDQALAAAVVQLAQRLELRVVAQGVETEMQAAVLAEMGCHVQQGFLYGRPGLAAGFSCLLMSAGHGECLRTA